MTSVVLFGPPGVGKTTLVHTFARMYIDTHGIDLESFEDRKTALKCINRKHNNLVGAADLQPEDFPGDWIRVLILPDMDVYMDRVEHRNRLVPRKRGQQEKSTYRGFSKNKDKFDYIIRNISISKGVILLRKMIRM